MAGTNSSRPSATGGPAIVLIASQLGANVGAAARAMLNCGLTDLRLVEPREGWPNPQATVAASGADVVLEQARLFPTAEAAVAGLHRVYATTARPRDMNKPVLTPRQAAAELRAAAARGEHCGVLFGPERTGLLNEHVLLADAVITVPLNPAFSSLNLAQCVLLVAYEWFQTHTPEPPRTQPHPAAYPAPKEDLLAFFEHLEAELEAAGYFTPPEKRPALVSVLRNLFHRAGLLAGEVRTLRGVVRTLAGSRRPPHRPASRETES